MSSAETEGVPGARPGDVLNGKYRVDKVLGAGGMGVVVAATHLQLDEKVAIKFLLPDAAKQKDVVERFDREAKAAVKIKSEHVARVSDVGKLDNGAPYMVMEFLHGKDLAQMVEDHGALPVAASVEYLLQACEALAEAHALGIVHRDLKPANLFLTQRADGSPCIKVLDFGISKMLNSLSNPGMTKTTAVMGSPLYMSPEQMKSSKDVDHRTDIWSLGAILYELLSGNPPFLADTMPQLCLMILQEPLPPLAQVRRDIPPQLEAVVQRCQAKDPNHRFQNVAELAAALSPFVTGRARLSAERIADVLRAAPRASALSMPTPTPAPPAGAPYGNTGGYTPPGPTVAGAPYGVSSPNLPPGHYGQTAGGFAAQAQTGGGFSQSNPAHTPIGAGATVVATPGMAGFGPPGATTGGHARPAIGASTASAWEGSLGTGKKKGSTGIIVGAIAGAGVLAGIAIAVAVLSGGSSEGAAANAMPLPSGAADAPAVQPNSIVPAVSVTSDTPSPAASAEPTASAAASTAPATPAVTTPPARPGTPSKIVKPAPSPAPTPAPTPTPSSTPTPAPTKPPPSPGKLETDRK